MLIKLNDSWFVDSSLVSCVRFHEEDKTVGVYFFKEGLWGQFKGSKSDVARIVRAVNKANKGGSVTKQIAG